MRFSAPHQSFQGQGRSHVSGSSSRSREERVESQVSPLIPSPVHSLLGELNSVMRVSQEPVPTAISPSLAFPSQQAISLEPYDKMHVDTHLSYGQIFKCGNGK